MTLILRRDLGRPRPTVNNDGEGGVPGKERQEQRQHLVPGKSGKSGGIILCREPAPSRVESA